MALLCVCAVYEWFLERDNWKDIIIPIISGLAIPALIFLMTVGREKYRLRYDNYIFRDSLFFKLRAWKEDIQLSISALRKQMLELNNIDNEVKELHFRSKNVSDLIDVSFERCIEAFQAEIAKGKGFATDFNNLTDSLDVVGSINEQHYHIFFKQYSLERLELHNSNVFILKEIDEIVKDSRRRVHPDKNGRLTDIWLEINRAWSEFELEKPSFEERETLLKAVKSLGEEAIKVYSSKTDSADTIIRSITQVLENMQRFVTLNDELKTQLENYLSQYALAVERIDILLPEIRTNKPRVL
ncbi:hypothetical protein [Sphingobacterium gobiense]|uniref:Uncharacterized protein n=1 Tax=Sphingobacterium gobiense TaxID=1382456 RepID=A0A2S9JU24_9SPHI|nr:hypothetical protein [Sphingobacterium gobiense]PRD56750.1 hypothetical protein C5749_05845 [Sphingobacterium gobiense]